jgi:hypothetical protein
VSQLAIDSERPAILPSDDVEADARLFAELLPFAHENLERAIDDEIEEKTAVLLAQAALAGIPDLALDGDDDSDVEPESRLVELRELFSRAMLDGGRSPDDVAALRAGIDERIHAHQVERELRRDRIRERRDVLVADARARSHTLAVATPALPTVLLGRTRQARSRRSTSRATRRGPPDPDSDPDPPPPGVAAGPLQRPRRDGAS